MQKSAMTSEEATTPEKAAPVPAEAAAADPKASGGDAPPAAEKQKTDDKQEQKQEPKAGKGEAASEAKGSNESSGRQKRGGGRGTRKAATAAAAVAPSPAREGMRRERKKVERLSEVIDKQYQLAEQSRIVLPKGSGACLKDCPRVAYFMAKSKPEDLKLLHSLVFNRVGKVAEVRKNLLDFNGFEFGADSKEYEKLVEKTSSKKPRDLKKTLYALDLDRGAGNARQLAERICRFLLRPSDNGKKPPAKLPARPQRSGKRRGLKPESSDSADDDDNDELEAMDEEEEDKGASEKAPTDSEEEEAAPKAKRPRRQSPAKRKRPASTRKAPAAKRRRPAKKKKASSEEDEPSSLSEDEDEQPEEQEEKSAAPEAKEKAKAEEKKEEAKEEEEEEQEEDSEDDVPLKQLKKPEAAAKPSDEELKGVVKKLLDGADMDTLTVKGVIKEVFAKFEGVDLSDRKDFIRTTIKEALK